MYIKRVPLDEIGEPSDQEKLHPPSEETSGKWEAFKESVGEQPDKPLDVWKHNGALESVDRPMALRDGDRRFRALKENRKNGYEIEEVYCRVFEEDELTVEEFHLGRVRANLHREDNDPLKEAEYLAQFCAPWLLRPDERFGVERKTQEELAEDGGLAGSGSISNKLNPLRHERPVRDVLGQKTSHRTPSDEEIETIDEIVYILNHGTEDGGKVLVGPGHMTNFCDGVKGIEGVSLGEIQQVTEKASEEVWNTDKLVKTIQEEFAEEPSRQPSSAGKVTGQGVMGGSDPFEDESPARSHDGPKQAGPIQTDGDPPDSDPQPIFPDPVTEVNWDEVLDDDMFPEDTTVEDIKRKVSMTIGSTTFQDDAAIGLHAVKEMYGMELTELKSKVIDPAVAEHTVATLSSE